ncbi:thioesterase-like superfamily-domain-containing protein [Chytriomyces cf. hyalinus JEL632]|nr:thioesterase-like superfamily-domain-containing protein [Chytriomyces cf. hyalinus JEL632]
MAKQYFYRRLSKDTFQPTDLTIGPWSVSSQHGGPPSALMASMLREHAGDSFRLARMSVTLYRPIPATGEHRLHISCLSETRSTKHLVVTYVDAVSNRIYARAEAILLARTDTATPATRAHLEYIDATTRAADVQHSVIPQFPSPTALQKQLGSQSNAPLSTFMQAMQTVFEPSRAMYGSKTHDCVHANRESACVWYARPAAGVGFWPGRELDAVDRAVMFGDMSSGASAVLEYGVYIYSNVDYTVNFLRDPEPDTIGMNEQEWVCFRPRTRINPGGSGVTASKVFDRRGIFAATLQNLITRKMESRL